jgi:antitoxin component YwqK of YwqJK toxin-antitoxin module
MQDKIPHNEQGQPHGYWVTYWDNGKLCHKGLYINSKRNGFHENYWSDGKLFYKGSFIDGQLYGYLEHYLTKKIYYAR